VEVFCGGLQALAVAYLSWPSGMPSFVLANDTYHPLFRRKRYHVINSVIYITVSPPASCRMLRGVALKAQEWTMPRARALIDGASLGPEALKTVGQAFDQAWTEIAPYRANGDRTNDPCLRDVVSRRQFKSGCRGLEKNGASPDDAELNLLTTWSRSEPRNDQIAQLTKDAQAKV
jgi:hypothetical protein